LVKSSEGRKENGTEKRAGGNLFISHGYDMEFWQNGRPAHIKT